MTFEEFNLKKEIVKALNEQGITNPTAIQTKAIPLIKAGKDLIGLSKTGSGKTVAFGAPVIDMLDPNGGLQVLMLAPTRELAVQIARELQKFGKYLRFSVATVYGGVALGPQIKSIARANIVVSTPGRLLDHLQRGNIDLSGIKCAVLDEADKMVEMGFIEDISKILSQMPRNRQMLLFGATASREIKKIKQRFMNDPITAKAEMQVKDDFLKQYYYNVDRNDKFSLLVHLLNKEDTERVIIFCSARSTVEIVAQNLKMNGVKAEMMHGKLSQNRRLNTIENFNKGNPKILVASPVAARGLDIKDVTHIFNYDLSQDPQEYVHRVGRTARAGEAGKAITLLSQRDHDVFRSILSNHQVKVDVLPKENFAKIRFKARVNRFHGNNRNRFKRRSSGPRRSSDSDRSDRFSGSRSGGRGQRFIKRGNFNRR